MPLSSLVLRIIASGSKFNCMGVIPDITSYLRNEKLHCFKVAVLIKDLLQLSIVHFEFVCWIVIVFLSSASLVHLSFLVHGVRSVTDFGRFLTETIFYYCRFLLFLGLLDISDELSR